MVSTYKLHNCCSSVHSLLSIANGVLFIYPFSSLQNCKAVVLFLCVFGFTLSHPKSRWNITNVILGKCFHFLFRDEELIPESIIGFKLKQLYVAFELDCKFYTELNYLSFRIKGIQTLVVGFAVLSRLLCCLLAIICVFWRLKLCTYLSNGRVRFENNLSA